MIQRVLGTAFALLIGLALSAMLGEIGARLVSSQDEDGNVVVASTRLRPYRMPIARVRERVEELRQRTDLCLHYDAGLGWSPQPSRSCLDGQYIYDAQGIRAPDPSRTLAPTPATNTRRIVIVGDSFTHGDDVPYQDTWGSQLEQLANGSDAPIEVINLGVGGYGMDQALLRWRELGPALHPTTVVLGFQVENILRNLNMIRPLYFWGTDLPFAKPRLVMEGGQLRAINVPVLPPQQLAATLSGIEDWDLVRFEHYYDASDYHPRLLRRSRLVAFVQARLDRARDRTEAAQRRLFAPGTEAFELALRILDQLRSEAHAAGSDFRVVHLPRRPDLEWVTSQKGPLPYDELLQRLDHEGELVDPLPAMIATVRRSQPIAGLFGAHGHYSAFGNRIVAETLAQAIAAH